MSGKDIPSIQQTKSIKIDGELYNFLNKVGNRGETFSQVIKRMILTKKFNKEQKEMIEEMVGAK